MSPSLATAQSKKTYFWNHEKLLRARVWPNSLAGFEQTYSEPVEQLFVEQLLTGPKEITFYGVDVVCDRHFLVEEPLIKPMSTSSTQSLIPAIESLFIREHRDLEERWLESVDSVMTRVIHEETPVCINFLNSRYLIRLCQLFPELDELMKRMFNWDHQFGWPTNFNAAKNWCRPMKVLKKDNVFVDARDFKALLNKMLLRATNTENMVRLTISNGSSGSEIRLPACLLQPCSTVPSNAKVA